MFYSSWPQLSLDQDMDNNIFLTGITKVVKMIKDKINSVFSFSMDIILQWFLFCV